MADKLTTRHFTQLKVEASYAAETATLPTTDSSLAFHTHEEPQTSLAWQFDGNLEGEGAAGGSTRPHLAPSGRNGEVSLATRFRKTSATYTASVKPMVVDALRVAGYNAAFTAGPPATWTMTPLRAGYASGAVDVYKHGEVEHFFGVYFNRVEIAAEGPTVPVWTFAGRGIANRPADASVPSVGYPAYERSLAKAIGASVATLQLTSGAQTVALKSRSFNFVAERPIEELVNQGVTAGTGAQHPGFDIGNEVVTLETVVEARVRATASASPYAVGASGAFDPSAMLENAQPLSLALTIRTSGQPHFTLSGATVSLAAEPERDGAGPTALWRLRFQCNASADHLADSHSIVMAYT